MQRLEPFTQSDPPDFMRRFLPTPLKAVYRIGAARVTVETNDVALLPGLPLAAGGHEVGEQSMQWKLIRDTDAHGALQEPMFLTSATITVVAMGTACLLGLDHLRRELLGFIGGDIDARTYQEFLVPFLYRMTSELSAWAAVPCVAQNSERSFNV